LAGDKLFKLFADGKHNLMAASPQPGRRLHAKAFAFETRAGSYWLIGLLCEADLRGANLPVSAVTLGDNLAAKDGGPDVRVSLPTGTAVAGLTQRAEMDFQVKKPDMPASACGRLE